MLQERWVTIADTPVMVFEPESREGNGPAIIYLHGGGWTWFSPNSYRYVTQSLAKETNYLVMSVDYPRAPQYIHPVPTDTCIEVVRNILQNADKYGVDKNRIVVAGDSSGGQLAAAVTIALKDSKPVPAAQVCIYPTLQYADFGLPSFQNTSKLPHSTASIAWFSQLHALGTVDLTRVKIALLNQHISSLHQDNITKILNHTKLPKENFHKKYKALEYAVTSPYPKLEDVSLDTKFSPLLTRNLTNIPPTLIITMRYDAVRDDGFLYAIRLREAGVYVQHVQYNGWHGALISRTNFPFYEDIARFLKKVLKR